MSRERFDEQIAALSHEAIEARAKNAEEVAYQIKRDHIKQTAIWGIVALLWGIALTRHAEIRDTVARLFDTSPLAYKEVLELAEETGDEPAEEPDDTTPPDNRKAKLREAMRRAKSHAATVDSIMDYTPTAEK